MNREQIINMKPENLKKLRAKGLTYKEIAKKCGVHLATISTRFKEIKETEIKKL